MSESSRNYCPPVRSLREVLVIEPVQQHHGQDSILLAPGTHCLIGSSRACTLTIQAQGILPQHCRIVSGPNSTILKEFEGQTWLNDRPVSEPLELMENDRLAIGPAEFRLRMARAEEIEDSIPMRDSRFSSPDETDPVENLGIQQTRLTEESELLSRREKTLQQREQELTLRFEELEQTLRMASGEDGETATVAAKELDLQLHRLTVDSSLEEERQHLTGQQIAIEERQARLDERERDLKQEQHELRQRSREQDQRQRDHLEQLSQAEVVHREFQVRKKELDDQRQALEHLKAELAARGSHGSDSENSAARMLLDAERSELSGLRDQIERERDELGARLRDVDERDRLVERGDIDRQLRNSAERERKLQTRETDVRNQQTALELQRNQLLENGDGFEATLVEHTVREEEKAQVYATAQAALDECHAVLKHDRDQLGRDQEQLVAGQTELHAQEEELAKSEIGLHEERIRFDVELSEIAASKEKLQCERATLEQERVEFRY
ncbi:MAG: FHA domain-containing protein, partial [Planctomycetaceae bacterium]